MSSLSYPRIVGALTMAAVTILPTTTSSDEALVAVASNFSEVGEVLKRRFEIDGTHTIKLVSGSTGQLYAQISNGAPFEVLLAADAARPARLVADGLALEDSRFTYALGRLTLWTSVEEHTGESSVAVLASGEFRSLALANPAVAPYGMAAMDLLVALDLADTLLPKIVQGQNVSQTFSMVATGNAEIGLVALSHVLSPRNGNIGKRWEVPEDLYRSIRQDAVLLSRGASNPAARAFLRYLRDPDARAVITSYGYGISSPEISPGGPRI